MVTQIFGELLYYPEADSLMEFPTPESLKGRILISTKPPKEYLESKQCDDKDNEKELADKESSSPDLTDELETDDKVSIEPEIYLHIFFHIEKIYIMNVTIAFYLNLNYLQVAFDLFYLFCMLMSSFPF